MVNFVLDGSSDQAREVNPEVAGKFVVDVSINVDKKGTFYYAGLYTNDGEGVVQGIFCATLNAQTGASTMLANKELSDSDIKSFNFIFIV
jgi:hypothetical protein